MPHEVRAAADGGVSVHVKPNTWKVWMLEHETGFTLGIPKRCHPEHC